MNKAVFEKEQCYGTLKGVLKNALKNKPIIYRLTGQKSRIYFTKEDPKQPANVYNSGTTLIDNYRDKAGELAIHGWKVKLINSGKDPNIELKTRQDYGTLLHVLYGKILLGETTTFDKLDEFIIGFASEVRMGKEYLEKLVSSHMGEFRKDVASFLAWIKEYKVNPLGIELMVKSDKYKVATALDLICEVTVKEKGHFGEVYKSDSKATGAKKGDPKESYGEVKKVVIVDFKSGKKGFYAKNVIQLLLSRKIFEENFPKVGIDGIFNFAPNDWKGSNPTFKFYDQERENKQIDYLKSILENILERGMKEFEFELSKKKERIFNGKIDITKLGDTDNMFQTYTLEQMADMYFDTLETNE